MNATAQPNVPPLVLVVDDDPVACEVLGAALEAEGFAAESVTSGREALDRADACPPDALLLDLVMPGLDGFETCRALRQRPGLEHLPIVVMTGLNDDASIQRAYHNGATDFVAKPLQPLILVQRLRFVLRAAADRQALAAAREQALASVRAKSRFLANMSHEIRTPMNAVMGMLDLAQDADLDGQTRGYLRTAHNAASALLTVINDVLDVSRIESGSLEIDLQPVDVGAVVGEVCDLLRPSASTNELALRSVVAAELDGAVLLDGARLRQVLCNLVGNAIKFTPEGSVAVRVGRSPDGRMLVFEFVDSGIGMAAETLDSVFEPFTQADSSITRRFGGTGLGLTITRHLVEAMAGTIAIDSAPGAGTRVTVALPWRVAARGAEPVDSAGDAAEQPAAPAAGVPKDAGRVLVVEDNAVNRKVAQAMLARLGVDSDAVDDGDRGVAAVARGAYALVLMDCQMPTMDGLSATRAIRAREAEAGLPRLPIIALTADAMPEDEARCRDAGMDDYIAKPLRREVLATVLGRWLAGGRTPGGAAAEQVSPLAS